MNPMRTVSAAVLLAATLIVPATTTAFAATMDTAKITAGVKADIVPVDNLVGMVGSWTIGDLSFLDKATAVKTFDTKTLYPAADLAKVASAESAKSAQLGKLRDAIRADTGLSAWFSTNKIDINRVIAVADPKGNPEIFLY